MSNSSVVTSLAFKSTFSFGAKDAKRMNNDLQLSKRNQSAEIASGDLRGRARVLARPSLVHFALFK